MINFSINELVKLYLLRFNAPLVYEARWLNKITKFIIIIINVNLIQISFI